VPVTEPEFTESVATFFTGGFTDLADDGEYEEKLSDHIMVLTDVRLGTDDDGEGSSPIGEDQRERILRQIERIEQELETLKRLLNAP
jgi:hypothetical protein